MVGKQNADMVSLLIAKGANVNAADENGQTVLHCAVSMQNTNLVSVLLAKGADINLKNTAGKTPLDVARDAGCAKAISEVYAAMGIKVAKEPPGADDLIKIMKSNDANRWEQVIAMVVENPAALNETAKSMNPWSPFVYAISVADLPVVKFLVAKGGDVKQANVLTTAISRGKADIARFLLAQGAPVNPPDASYPPLCAALTRKDADMVELLLENGAEINPKKCASTPLGSAIEGGSTELVELMLEKGAKVNPDGSERKPLHDAVDKGNEEMVQMLLDEGADINIEAGEEMGSTTALELAIRTGQDKMVEFLVKKGADVNKTSRLFHKKMLGLAIQLDKNDIAEILRKNGAKE
jgi:ankyrin repeat protein